MENEKILGAVFGAALADCVGSYRDFNKDGGYFKKNPGLFSDFVNKTKQYYYTDDTQMAFGIIKSIVNNNGIDLDDIKEMFVSDYMRNPAGYGPGTGRLLSLVGNKKKSYDLALKNVNSKYEGGSYGNGAAMRIYPLGLLLHNKSDDELYKAVEENSRLTHFHEYAIDGAAIMAKAISLVFHNEVDEFFIDRIANISKTDIKRRILSIKEYLENKTPLKEVRHRLGTNITSQGSVPYAIYSFLKEKDSYNRCLMTAITLDNGDADTIGSMACALSGTYLGLSKINKNYKKIIDYEYIKDYANKFSEVVK